jgi:hypothetical protein
MVMQHGVGPKNLLLHTAYRPRYKGFAFACGLVLPYRVKQAANRQAKQYTALIPPYRVKQTAKRQAKQCTALIPPYRVKQTAKRQAKQCTALFCATPTH